MEISSQPSVQVPQVRSLLPLKAAIKTIIMLIALIPETSQSSTLTPQRHLTRRTSSLVRLKTQR
ncbi:hypothetical protein NC651_009364 [Populus alba x Populus x berolinensis]|nr:hypothetical protein NC651_009364 [Populus alba x Populus x berolinensis]